jgi:hypothetical protein
MGTTDRFDLTYPEQLDEPDGPAQIQALAEDVEGWLSRAFRVANASARATLGTALGSAGYGFLVIETDTKLPYMWNGTTWLGLTGSGGGGGGGAAGGATFTQTSAQSIPNTASGPGTIVSLPGGSAGSLIERTAQGSGHKFELLASGLWSADAQVRIATTSTAGEVSAAIRYDPAGGSNFDRSLAIDGGRREGLARTLQPGKRRYLEAGTTLAVFVYNGTGSTRQLEPNAGDWVNLDLWLAG